MANIVIPVWFFWAGIGGMALSAGLAIWVLLGYFDWRKWCPEGVAMRYARKKGGYVKFEHFASDEATISLGKVEVVKGKGMLKPNWFGKGSVRFIPEEGSGYVEHLPKGLKIVHYIGTHPGAKKITGIRAIEQMAEEYPVLFSEQNPRRRIAYRFLTVPEQQLLEDRPYELQENPEMFNEVMQIKARLTGTKVMYQIKGSVERLADVVDAKKYRKEKIVIDDFMEVLAVEPEEEVASGGNPVPAAPKMVTLGKLLFSEVCDVILDPATTANIANAFSIIEANTRRREANKPGEMMGYGFMILMICLGVGVLVYMVMSVKNKNVF